MEAQDLIGEVAATFQPMDLFSRDVAVKRWALKTLAYKMPGRPFLMFGYLYFFRLGLLDGLPGLRYTIMRSMYEYMIDLKVAEFRYSKNDAGGKQV